MNKSSELSSNISRCKESHAGMSKKSSVYCLQNPAIVDGAIQALTDLALPAARPR
ncbi:MAG: hypothetical protein ACLQT6_03640 [Desulfomonilaceae bacterium]